MYNKLWTVVGCCYSPQSDTRTDSFSLKKKYEFYTFLQEKYIGMYRITQCYKL